MKTNTLIYSVLLLVVLFTSCRKEIDITEEVIIPPVPTVKVESSVIGFVTDEYDQPVEDAVVKLGSKSIYTDENGIFQFKNETLNQNGSFLTVEKEDYFKGSRMFYPSLGNTNRIAIQLLEKVTVGEFSTSSGGKVSFDQVELDFKSNGIETEGGSDYNGKVSVAAKYLDPSLIETHEQMPGDLTAISADNELVALNSYAMIAVELTGENGEALQLKKDVPCEAKIPVPNSLQLSAPNEIELWSFDNSVGRWVEEGMANYESGFYMADIPHFSFWNCDVPRDYATLHVQVNNYDAPFIDVKVQITEISSGTSRYDRTDNDGKVNGKVPSNEDLLLEVLDICDEAIYSENIGSITGTQNIIIMTTYDNVSNVSGDVTSCSSTISDISYVRIIVEEHISYFPIDDGAEFLGTVNYCEETSVVKAKAVDPVAGLTSQTSVMDLSDDIDFGNLEMCDTLIEGIFSYQYGDTLVSITFDNPAPPHNITYEIENLEDVDGNIIKHLVTCTVVNWNTGMASTINFIHDYASPGGSITFSHPESGFNVEGDGDSFIQTQGGSDFLIFTGELDNFTITDAGLWDDSFSPYYYYISFELNL